MNQHDHGGTATTSCFSAPVAVNIVQTNSNAKVFYYQGDKFNYKTANSTAKVLLQSDRKHV